MDLCSKHSMYIGCEKIIQNQIFHCHIYIIINTKQQHKFRKTTQQLILFLSHLCLSPVTVKAHAWIEKKKKNQPHFPFLGLDRVESIAPVPHLSLIPGLHSIKAKLLHRSCKILKEQSLILCVHFDNRLSPQVCNHSVI